MESTDILDNTLKVIIENSPSAFILMFTGGLLFWVIIQIMYSIKISKLRNQLAEEIKTRTEITGQLETHQQQIAQLKNEFEQLQYTAQQSEKDKLAETQRANGLNTQLVQQAGELKEITTQLQLAIQNVEQLQSQLAQQVERANQLEQEKYAEADKVNALIAQASEQNSHLMQGIESLSSFLEETLSTMTECDTATLWHHHRHLTEKALTYLTANKQALDDANAQVNDQALVITNLRHALASQSQHQTELTIEIEQQRSAQLEMQYVLEQTQHQLERVQQPNGDTSSENIDVSAFQGQLAEKDEMIAQLKSTIQGLENHVERMARMQTKIPANDSAKDTQTSKESIPRQETKPIEPPPAVTKSPEISAVVKENAEEVNVENNEPLQSETVEEENTTESETKAVVGPDVMQELEQIKNAFKKIPKLWGKK